MYSSKSVGDKWAMAAGRRLEFGTYIWVIGGFGMMAIILELVNLMQSDKVILGYLPSVAQLFAIPQEYNSKINHSALENALSQPWHLIILIPV